MRNGKRQPIVEAMALLGRHDHAMELLDVLNPILRRSRPEDVARYHVEPYVLAGDVYSHPQHSGRGGWTWYTGAAGWFYRVALETMLGLHRRGHRLAIRPRIPDSWAGYEIIYRFGSATYHILIDKGSRPDAQTSISVDGVESLNDFVELHDDGRSHEVRVAGVWLDGMTFAANSSKSVEMGVDLSIMEKGEG
jgi:cellobiose phosphorylase